MATKSVTDVGHAVLIAALESAINPLWDCVLKEYCDIYGLSIEELREQFPLPFNVVDKFSICFDVVDDINERMNNES